MDSLFFDTHTRTSLARSVARLVSSLTRLDLVGGTKYVKIGKHSGQNKYHPESQPIRQQPLEQEQSIPTPTQDSLFITSKQKP